MMDREQEILDRLSEIENTLKELVKLEERSIWQQKEIERLGKSVEMLWQEVRALRASIVALPWVERMLWIAVAAAMAWFFRKL